MLSVEFFYIVMRSVALLSVMLHTEAGLLNRSSCLVPALGVTKVPFANDIGSHFVVPLKSN
jgi:hypothetical protein